MTTANGNQWAPDVAQVRGGYHRIVITPPGGTPVDVTFFRQTPTQLGPYSDADPFGDSTTQITLPQVSALDDFTTPELAWCVNDADVDIWFIPGITVPDDWLLAQDPVTGEFQSFYTGDTAHWMNPITGKRDSVAPAIEYVYTPTGTYKLVPDWTRIRRGINVWQGYVSSIGHAADGTSSAITLTCQGALFQIDCTLSKPSFPPRPIPLERLIRDQFSHEHNRSLRTNPCVVQWPDDWSYITPPLVIPNPMHDPDDRFDQLFEYGLDDGVQSSGRSSPLDPDIGPNKRWTGYTTRDTGQWSHRLTDTVQGWLQDMIVKPGSGATVNCQWTMRLRHAGHPVSKQGRTPVLMVRDTHVAASFSVWAAQPGVAINLDEDATQSANAIYGTGTDEGGVAWANSFISHDGKRTDYRPLAADRLTYPPYGNDALRPAKFLREAFNQYGTGFDEIDAIKTAELQLRRDDDPGFSGTITLSTDPSSNMTRWEITAGMTMVLKGFRGSGAAGVRFHIASTQKDPTQGTVQLTVDTRYRDMLTVGEAVARTRDPLTPLRMLQLNANSTTIQDIQAPWSYAKGSGFVPHGSTRLFSHMPQREDFPYEGWVAKHPPKKHPQFYVPVHANAQSSRNRWTAPAVQVRMSERGTIRRSEFACFDRHGNLVPVKFHVSFYYVNGITYRQMPTDDGKVYSPWIRGAFESIDPKTGQPWTKHPNLAGDTQNYIEGWGNYAQPAGYSPGLYTRGGSPTGMLVDESSWTFDCSAHNKQYNQLAKAGHERPVAISVWAMFYAEHHEELYFIGRLFVSPPGTTG